MPTAYVVLLVANVIYATGYTVTRVVLDDVGPATLALGRLLIGTLVLVPLVRIFYPEAGPLDGRSWPGFSPRSRFSSGRISCLSPCSPG